jgi:hypothetical protein
MGGLNVDEVSQLRKKEERLLIGICTEDFSLLHDVLKILKDRGIHHAVLERGQAWDSNMDSLALQDGLETPHFSLRKPPIIIISRDPSVTVDRAIAAALGRSEPRKLVIGIDPGKRPGMAFLADGILISAQRSTGPDDIILRLKNSRKAFRPSSILIRIGNGDPESRDPIIEAVREAGYPLEIVDESRTTKTKRYRDENAAVLIAQTKGDPVPI